MPDAWVTDGVCETHEWQSSTGDVVRFVTRTEAKARMMPPVTIATIRPPNAQGARFRGARHEARLVTLPVVVPGPQDTDGRAEVRRWAKALDPLKGEGTLTVVQGTFAGRVLDCVYETGLENYAEEWGFLGLTTLGFRAADPYWRDATDTTVEATPVEGLSATFPHAGTWAANPLVLGSSDAFATATLTNTGDVVAWPVVTAVGPGSGLTVTNDTTGETWTWEDDVLAGETLVVDCRPGHKSALLDGVNRFSGLSYWSVLWSLALGENDISVGFSTVSEASSVTFAWKRRWLAA